MRDFNQLKVWEKSHTLVLEIYKMTKSFPEDERYGLTAQIRRAVASIPTNISEGCGRTGEKELARFLSIAAGSASEVEYQILLSYDLNYIKKETYLKYHSKINEIKRMLNSFIQKLNANS